MAENEILIAIIYLLLSGLIITTIIIAVLSIAIVKLVYCNNKTNKKHICNRPKLWCVFKNTYLTEVATLWFSSPI